MESNGWVEVVKAVVPFLTVFIALFKLQSVLGKVFSTRRRRLRTNYKYIKENLADGRWQKMDDYSLAYSYWALSGYRFDATILRYFFGQNESLNKLTDYAYGARFIQIERNQSQKVIKLSLRELFGIIGSRKWQVAVLSWLFFVCGVLAILPIIPFFLFFDGVQLFPYTYQGLTMGVLWGLSFIMLSVLLFLSSRDIHAAIRLTEESSGGQLEDDELQEIETPEDL